MDSRILGKYEVWLEVESDKGSIYVYESGNSVNWKHIAVVTLALTGSANVGLPDKVTNGLVQAQVKQVEEKISEEGPLSSGGVFKGIDGITIQAPYSEMCAPVEGVCNDEAITNQVNVFVRPTEAPTAQYPLPDGWLPITPFYSVGSPEAAHTPGSGMFEITFKVPAGFDPNIIAVALLEPAGAISDSDSEEDFFWSLRTDSVDTKAGTVTQRISHLSKQGFIYVLVTKLKSENPPQN